MNLETLKTSALSLTATAAATLGVTAAAQTYTTTLGELNSSGASGAATLTLDTLAQTLRVQLTVDGVETGQTHVMHIHGRFDGGDNPIDSLTPTLADDADGDGFIEVLEGVGQYGDIILSLTTPPSSNNDPNTQTFAMDVGGTITLDETYDLTNEGQFFSAVTGADYEGSDLLPLTFREIVVHGMSVDGSAGAGTGGEIDGTAGYKAVLPIAAGEIVPEPATAGLLALGGLTMLRRRGCAC